MSAVAAPPADMAAGPPEKADLTAWLGVIAGAVGSLMATLDISIVNASLPIIQGEIGASVSEGTWVATAYLVAEIIIIPLTGWLERLFGLRRLLLICAALFTAFSILCGVATNLETMIVGRVGQGLTGGAMIPTAMTIIATRLPRHQQPIGTAMFGATVILGPVMGPLVGGWLTENLSWHYAFFVNVPICIALIALLLIGLPARRADWSELRNADWAGVVGMSLGLGALTVVLEDGHRESWFESALIWQLSGLSLAGFLLMGWGQWRARVPVIRLALLRNRSFAAVFVLGLAVGALLYSTAYVIPQFLAAIAGYNALQAGKVVFLSGVPALVMMGLVPWMIRTIDVRIAVGAGFFIMALCCWLDTSMTAATSGPDFTATQLLRGVGQILSMMFLNQAALASVGPEEAGDASGLFNAARNLGGSIGLALLASVQDVRFDVHRWSIHDRLQANDPALQAQLAGDAAALGGGPEGAAAALRMLDLAVQRDALVMAFNDVFWLLTMAVLAAVPLVLLLRPLPKDRFMMGMH